MKMLSKPPKYCHGYEDRHGKFRWYFRRAGFPKVPLPGLPWTPEFMAAYEKAAKAEKPEIGISKTAPGTISALIASYYRSSDYVGLADSTKTTYRGIIERFRAAHGHRLVKEMQTQNVRKLVEEKVATPAAANNLLRTIHLLMRHAVDLGWRKDDPTFGVRKIRNKTAGFLTWEEDHIETFERHHKPGTRARLAFALLLYTGQRRSDVVRMGRQHVRNGILSITQQKTGQDVHIPLHSGLRSILDTLPRDNLTFLMTAQGRPFTPAGFTNWFREMVREVTVEENGVKKLALPDGLSPHGLRKATCRRLAEANCTPHQIMAISGHRSLSEVMRYTIAASQKDLAAQAMLSIDKTKTRT